MSNLTKTELIIGCFAVLLVLGCETGDDLEGNLAPKFDEMASDGSAVYQAENAASKSGCSVAKKNAGYTGSGYMDFGGNGTWIEWNDINVGSAGNYTLTFRYAVSTGSRQCAVLINGVNAGNVPFSATGSWTTWKTVTITKALKAGNNTVRVLANTSSGGPNLDRMDLSGFLVRLPYKETFDSHEGSFKCNKNTCTWLSQEIDISGVSTVKIEGDIKSYETGVFESSDYLKLSYRVDGGDWKTFFNNPGELKILKLSQSSSVSGSKMQLKIDAQTSASNETYEVDNLRVGEEGGVSSSLPYQMSNSFTCSQNTCSWTSDPIRITGASGLAISAEARGDQYGQFESTDYLKMFYRIDSGSWVAFFNHTDDLAAQTITKLVPVSGSTIQIMLEAKTSASNEIYTVSRLGVTAAPVVDDWQCNKSYYGTHDGCDCGCGASDPDCNGSGCTGPDCKNAACARYHALCPEGQECFLVTDAYGGKWKDVEKDPNTSHDNLFCWVAGPANILDWSGWGQVGSLNSTDDIFLYAQKYWPPNNDDGPYSDGDDAYDFLEWFFVGDQPDNDYPPGGKFHSEVGNFPSYCNGNVSDPYVGLCPDKMKDDPEAIMRLLNAGFAAALQLKGDVGGDDGGHVISLWGYSVDRNDRDLMTGVFLTNSDDDKSLTNPPDRLFYREVFWDGVWHILEEDGSPYKYIKYVYGLRQK